jgi:two-component system nitrate/nitrite sensor histidine kinase NarX
VAAGASSALPRWAACLLRAPAGRGHVFGSPVCRLIAVLLVAMLLLSALALAGGRGLTDYLASALSLVGLGLVVLLYVRIDRQLLVPLRQLRDWTLRVREGDLRARLPVPASGEFRQVARDINDLGDTFERLSQRLDQEVLRQTERLAQKTRSLQVLYDVAASVNIFDDLDDLLTRFLHPLMGVARAKAATVRLLDKDGQMRLVASAGLSEQERKLLLSGDPPVWSGATGRPDGVDGSLPAAGAREPPAGVRGLHVTSVPLRYQGKTLGLYNLFVDSPALLEREDVRDLLTSIGRHLGMAIEKARVDSQAQRLSITQERTLLAHELHDSLAQTLASLRFQFRMLDDTLAAGNMVQARRELERLQNGLEEANGELRGLLAHFRAPIDGRGLLPALEDLVARFRRETGIVTFFQRECVTPDLSASQEMQVLRIVQEALANIRKHSRAHAVRLLFRCDGTGHYHVMVEDDGIGFEGEAPADREGEHIGLTVLQERARRLGGDLTVESEPAEGTRIELNFTDARAR